MPAQTRLFFADAATVTGKSPGMATGLPIILRHVGSNELIQNIVSVLEPALTTKRFCSWLVPDVQDVIIFWDDLPLSR